MALVKQSTQAQIATLTLTRPEKRNALNAELIDELITAIVRAEREDLVRVIILTGAGGSFCAGADLQQLRELQDQSAMDNRSDSYRLAQLFSTIYHCETPVIARVNGDAFGGGAGILAVCDWSVAAEQARIGFPEVRLGFVPAIVMPFLVRRIGEGSARNILLRGRRMDASEAATVGLVHEIVSGDELEETVEALAREIVRETSGSAVALTKRLLGQIGGMKLETALETAVLTNAFARGTEDCKAGVAAFLAGDAPPWKKSFKK